MEPFHTKNIILDQKKIAENPEYLRERTYRIKNSETKDTKRNQTHAFIEPQMRSINHVEKIAIINPFGSEMTFTFDNETLLVWAASRKLSNYDTKSIKWAFVVPIDISIFRLITD